MSAEGWNKCEPNFFLQGFYREECHSLYCLSRAKCCDVHDSEWDKCTSTSWREQMAAKGWAYAPGALFLTGLLRVGTKTQTSTNGIASIQMASSCAFKKRVKPKYCGDSIRSQDLKEECDDGNQYDDDGCSSTCKVENGWRCRNSNTPLKVTDIEISSGSTYEKMVGGLGAGKKCYTDQDYTVAAIGNSKLGGEYAIVTTDADKATDQLTIKFKVNQNVRLFVLVDSKTPSSKLGWLKNKFQKTSRKLPIAGRATGDHFVVYKAKHVHQGALTVGPSPDLSHTDAINHIVVVKRAICNEVTPYSKGTVKLVGKMTFKTLVDQLDKDSTGNGDWLTLHLFHHSPPLHFSTSTSSFLLCHLFASSTCLLSPDHILCSCLRHWLPCV